MENVTGNATGWGAWSQLDADHARARYEFSVKRRSVDEGKSLDDGTYARPAKRTGTPANSPVTDPVALEKKRTVVEAALARARLKAR